MVERAIRKEVTVAAPAAEVWAAWSTEEGVRTFFAPRAAVQLAIGGRYEMLFDLDATPGSQGGEGLTILSYSPGEMLSFEWNAPPQFGAVRNQKTWVVVQIEAKAGGNTQVALTHLGWQEGEEWEQVYDYFLRAWDVVLGRLQHRFSVGPVDWSNPYRPSGS
jgi:uncharacterized protein YndB with AHSA1/START domain